MSNMLNYKVVNSLIYTLIQIDSICVYYNGGMKSFQIFKNILEYLRYIYEYNIWICLSDKHGGLPDIFNVMFGTLCSDRVRQSLQ